jgi:hypothetical protein
MYPAAGACRQQDFYVSGNVFSANKDIFTHH